VIKAKQAGDENLKNTDLEKHITVRISKIMKNDFIDAVSVREPSKDPSGLIRETIGEYVSEYRQISSVASRFLRSMNVPESDIQESTKRLTHIFFEEAYSPKARKLSKTTIAKRLSEIFENTK